MIDRSDLTQEPENFPLNTSSVPAGVISKKPSSVLKTATAIGSLVFGSLITPAAVSAQATPGTALASATPEDQDVDPLQETLETKHRATQLPDFSDPRVFQEFERIIRERGFVYNGPLSVDPKTFNWPTMEQIRITKIQMDMKTAKNNGFSPEEKNSTEADIPDSAAKATSTGEAPVIPPLPPESAPVQAAEPKEEVLKNKSMAELEQEKLELQKQIQTLMAEKEKTMSPQLRMGLLAAIIVAMSGLTLIIMTIKNRKIKILEEIYRDQSKRLREQASTLNRLQGELRLRTEGQNHETNRATILEGKISDLEENLRVAIAELEGAKNSLNQQLQSVTAERDSLRADLQTVSERPTYPPAELAAPSQPEAAQEVQPLEDNRATEVPEDPNAYEAKMRALDSAANGSNPLNPNK